MADGRDEEQPDERPAANTEGDAPEPDPAASAPPHPEYDAEALTPVGGVPTPTGSVPAPDPPEDASLPAAVDAVALPALDDDAALPPLGDDHEDGALPALDDGAALDPFGEDEAGALPALDDGAALPPTAGEEDGALPAAALDSWSMDADEAAPVRSWSSLAELDTADSEVSEDEPPAPIGGLLGVDSGLLRFLEREESTPPEGLPPPSPDASAPPPGALPADLEMGASAPSVNAPAPDSGAFSLPLDLDLSDDVELPFELPEDFDAFDDGEEDEDEGVLPEGLGTAPPAVEGPPSPMTDAKRAEAEAEAKAQAEADEAAANEDSGWLDKLIDDLEVDDNGAEWANGVVTRAVLRHAEDGWKVLEDGGLEVPLAELGPGEVVEPAESEDFELAEQGLDDLEEAEPVPAALYEEGESPPPPLPAATPPPAPPPAPVEGPQVVDTWSAGGGAWSPPPPADPFAGRVDELDPFAMPVSGGLADETGVDDPFDTLAAGTSMPLRAPPLPPAAPPPSALAPVTAPPFAAPASPPPAPEVFVEPEAPAIPEEPAIERPAPEAVRSARALLAERSAQRRLAIEDAAHAAELVRVEEDVGGAEPRVTVIEYADVDALEVEEADFDGEPPEATLPPDQASTQGFVFFDSDSADDSEWGQAVAALIDEPVHLEELLEAPEPTPRIEPVEPEPAPPLELEITDADVVATSEMAAVRVPSTPPPPPAAQTFEEPGERSGLDDSLRPSWGGSEPPQPVYDPRAFERSGVTFLGAIPTFGGVVAAVSAGQSEVAAPTGLATLPQLPRVARSQHGLLERLLGEIGSEVDRRRLALLLVEVAVLAAEELDDDDLRRATLRAARTNDPDFELGAWLSHAALIEAGATDEVVAQLARRGGKGDADALYRAGHLALARLGDPERALALWQRANEVEPEAVGPLLARLFARLQQLEWEAAVSVLDAALEAVVGDTTWGVLALERVRLESEVGSDPGALRGLFRRALERVGGTAGLLAALEPHAIENEDLELLLAGLRARFDHVMGQYRAGSVREADAQWEVGEVFCKAAWALERQGRHAEALEEYHNALKTFPADPFVLHRAGELARRLGRPDEHRACLARAAKQAEDPMEAANAWYQMGLIAQQVLADEAAAAEEFARAAEVLPTFTPALAALGRQALRAGRWIDLQERFVDEIEQLEKVLDAPLAPTVRERAVQGLLSRYYRVARLLEARLAELDVALDYDKRALALEPDFLPAFVAMERQFVERGRWRELVALYLGRVERGGVAPIQAVSLLLEAADVLVDWLDDPVNAARLMARALSHAPDHAYGLQRAAEVFARLGNQGARIEVELRRGDGEGADAAAAVLRAAQLQELDGDSLAAAAEALPLYRRALELLPDEPAAVDGLLRVAARLNRAGELAVQVERLDLGALDSPVLVLQLAEALLAAGRLELSGRLLRGWLARRRESGRFGPADAAALELLEIVCERAEDWRGLVDVLEEQARHREDAAPLLARVGELWEMRLDEPAAADDAWQRGLAIDPDSAAALDGRARLRASRREPWTPRAPASGLEGAVARAAASEAAGDLTRRDGLLQTLAASSAPGDPRAAAACRIAGTEDLRSLLQAYERAPERRDRFDAACRALLEVGERRALLATIWHRVQHETPEEKPALLARLLGYAFDFDDLTSARRAARALLELDPDSLPARLALRRLALESDAADEARSEGLALIDRLQAPQAAAAAQRVMAAEAEAAGAPADEVRAMLARAVSLDPTDARATDALEDRLRAAAEWVQLLGLYDRHLRAVPDSSRRRELARRKAHLLAEQFDDPRRALTTLSGVLADRDPAQPLDWETPLLAAELAETLGESAVADRYFGEAVAAGADDGHAESTYARALLQRGAVERAVEVLDTRLRVAPDDRRALELRAEAAGLKGDWVGAVERMHRLFTLSVDPVQRARRALAIGEILSRVMKDHRRASGWFKRAVELDPDRLASLWRLLDEVGRLPPEAVPAEHVADALDRAIGSARRRHAERPGDATLLGQLAQLFRRRGDADGCFLACAALVYLGEADAPTRAYYLHCRERLAVDFARPLAPSLRRAHLVHPEEHNRAGGIFATFWLVLTELLAERMPQGTPRLSRRSFSAWQGDFRQLAAGLGIEDVELWNAGEARDPLVGNYLPQPALAVSARLLESRIDAAQAYALGDMLEGLRDGRLLLERHGPLFVSEAVAAMGNVVSPGLVESSSPQVVPTALRERLERRAMRLPQRLRLELESLQVQRARAELRDFEAFADAVRSSRRRAGLLSCGDLHCALDQLLFDDARAAEAARNEPGAVAARLAHDADARALLVYALGPDFARLRRALGVAAR